ILGENEPIRLGDLFVRHNEVLGRDWSPSIKPDCEVLTEVAFRDRSDSIRFVGAMGTTTAIGKASRSWRFESSDCLFTAHAGKIVEEPTTRASLASASRA